MQKSTNSQKKHMLAKKTQKTIKVANHQFSHPGPKKQHPSSISGTKKMT